MEFGHFVGVHLQKGQVCFNSKPTTLEEFMDMKDITDTDDVIGPFKEPEPAVLFQKRVADFFIEWDRKGNRTLPVTTLKDLWLHKMI
jgi:hypothetical protein